MLIVATPVENEDHVANDVIICGVISCNVPVAANCWDVPLGILGAGGDTIIDSSKEVWKKAVPDWPS